MTANANATANLDSLKDKQLVYVVSFGARNDIPHRSVVPEQRVFETYEAAEAFYNSITVGEAGVEEKGLNEFEWDYDSCSLGDQTDWILSETGDPVF